MNTLVQVTLILFSSRAYALAAPFLTRACSRRASRPCAGGRRRSTNCNRNQLACKRLMTSPKAFKQQSGRLPAQPIHVLVSNFYCQIISNNRVLDLGYDYSKLEGLSKSKKCRLFYSCLKTLWLTTQKGDKGACSNKIFHCERTDRSNHHFCLKNF